MMEGKNVMLKTGFLLVLLVVCHAAESKWMPVMPVIPNRPLCTSQFTLVNHACAFLPYTPTPHHRSPPSPQSSVYSSDVDDHHRRHHSPPEGGGRHHHDGDRNHQDGGRHHQQDGGGRHHHQDGGGRGRRSGEGQHRRHRRRHHHESDVQQDCCRWLKEVDDECVCDLLVHLPPFLSRPLHRYTVRVDDTCTVTFQCGSRLKLP
ncbi:uncharacterized protein LOC116004325 [Ipomoea triloba]|uniref:uncharacterized protein LOC116004325 n=1 Tax=Ipomoea triloba TaxID=35885 RepID=UPI00125DD287|nr:uncharacterized protein LOC116004325 [Ipomoea triloba]